MTRIFSILLLIGLAWGQVWNKSFGTDGEHEYGKSIQETSDSGYVIAGNFFDGSELKIGMLKTDKDGNEQWTKYYNDSGTVKCMQTTIDSGFVITGATIHDEVFLIKTNVDGLEQWNKKYIQGMNGVFQSNIGFWVEQTLDEGYVITGATGSSDSLGLETDLFILKVDSSGDSLWCKTYGESTTGINNFRSEWGTSIQQTEDGGYVILGVFYEPEDDGGSMPWLIRTDDNGDSLWTKKYQDFRAYPDDLLIDQNGNYTFIANDYSSQGLNPFRIIKTDPYGEIIFSNSLGDNVLIRSINFTSDHGYIVAGSQEHIDTHDHGYIAKTDSEGNIVWETIISTFGIMPQNLQADERFNEIRQTYDGKYIATGNTIDLEEQSTNIWLVKMNANLFPPSEANLLYPSEENTFSTNSQNNTTIPFLWSSSIDEDSVSYKLVIMLDFFNVIYSQEFENIPDTSFSVLASSLDPLLNGLNLQQSQILWHIESSDEEFTVSSDTGSFNLTRSYLNIRENQFKANQFILYPNHPNPFNPVTTLQYELPEDSFVDVTVYDMLGNVVNNLVHTSQSSGYKSIQWNATNNQGEPVSAGVYLYKIQAGGFVDTKKMILLK